MKKNLFSLHVFPLCLAFLITACSSPVTLYDKPTEPPAPPITLDSTTPANATATTTPINSASIQQQSSQQPTSSPTQTLTVSGLTVLFAYDSSTLDLRYRDVIQSNAELLRDNAQMHVMLEGHADEHGDNEYNLALGSRRAEAVKQALIALGVNATQIDTVSYGEERPKVLGSNEEAWAQNRRVEFNYNQK